MLKPGLESSVIPPYMCRLFLLFNLRYRDIENLSKTLKVKKTNNKCNGIYMESDNYSKRNEGKKLYQKLREED